MDKFHFISYSAVDGFDLALRLCDELQIGPPSIETWLDKHRLQVGADWDQQVKEAIRDCESLIFVMTRDSVEDASVCKNEWVQALKYKKPIVLVRCHAEAEPPFRLNSRQFVDFARDFNTGLARLRKDLLNLSSPRGVLQTLRYRLKDAQRDLRRATDPIERARIADEIDQLKKQIAEQQRLVADPQAAKQKTKRSIRAGLKRERQPRKPIGRAARSKFINPPPIVAPNYFQDRHVEIQLIGDFLKDEAKRLMTVVGRAGIGKSAMVCRVLKGLEDGYLPDGGGPLPVDGIVYLSEIGSRRVNVPNLFADLCRLLPATTAQPLDALYKDPKASTMAKLQALLAAFPSGRSVLLLDNFEYLLDAETGAIKDAELEEALRTLLNAPQHAVKVILTTRLMPHDLALICPGCQSHIHLDEGLDSPYAENILRAMDADGKVGLKTAPAALLSRAQIRTRGYPRALEALYAILSADRYTTLDEVLGRAENLLPGNVVEALVGEAYNRLDPAAQRVLQGVAVYERPVTGTAIDYLLQPYWPGVNSTPVLNRLVNMQFVRKESARYYLHPVDRAYALSRIPKGEVSDRLTPLSPSPEFFQERGLGGEVYTQYALLHRGADYFKQARQPRETWKKLDDLTPQLNEFELRYVGEDYDTAASVLLEIDFDYLQLWGHYRLMIELHERLQGKTSDALLKYTCLNNLGLAYDSTGRVEKALACYDQALIMARDAKHRQAEGALLGNLGNCYSDLGQTARAIEVYEQALAIAREIGDRRGEGTRLGNLGNRYSDLGQTARTIEFYEQALAIAREIGDRSGEGRHLNNLGECYAFLDRSNQAVQHYEQALAIRREIGDAYGVGSTVGNLARRYIDEQRYTEACKLALESVKIAVQISSPILGSRHNCTLALAYLCANDLPAARSSVETAGSYDLLENNHNVSALLGVIALRQGDYSSAQRAFIEAIAHADKMLGQTPQYYDALDAKGLALCGLALCGDTARVNDAIAAHRAARAINQDAGIVKRVLCLLDALAVVDTEGILRDVRPAAVGE